MLVPYSTSLSRVMMCQFFKRCGNNFIINKLYVSNPTMLCVIPSFSFPLSSLPLSQTPQMAPISTSLLLLVLLPTTPPHHQHQRRPQTNSTAMKSNQMNTLDSNLVHILNRPLCFWGFVSINLFSNRPKFFYYGWACFQRDPLQDL